MAVLRPIRVTLANLDAPRALDVPNFPTAVRAGGGSHTVTLTKTVYVGWGARSSLVVLGVARGDGAARREWRAPPLSLAAREKGSPPTARSWPTTATDVNRCRSAPPRLFGSSRPLLVLLSPRSCHPLFCHPLLRHPSLVTPSLSRHSVTLSSPGRYIDASDWRADDAADFFGFAPGKWVGLKYVGPVRVADVVYAKGKGPADGPPDEVSHQSIGRQAGRTRDTPRLWLLTSDLCVSLW